MGNSVIDFYRDLMKDHYANPRNIGLKNIGISCHKHNATCGDDVIVEALIEDGVIKEINHKEEGCLICCSSASIMSELLAGKTVEQAQEIFNDFKLTLAGNEVTYPADLQRLQVYSRMQSMPARVKCATLPWEALNEILIGKEG